MAFNLQDVLSLVEKIEILADHPETITGLENDNLRRRLREAGKKLSFAAEVPEDAGYRIMNTPLQLAATRVGLEKGIFKALAEANSSTLTKTELSNKTGIDPVLMSMEPQLDHLGCQTRLILIICMGQSASSGIISRSISSPSLAMMRTARILLPRPLQVLPLTLESRTCKFCSFSHSDVQEEFLNWRQYKHDAMATNAMLVVPR